MNVHNCSLDIKEGKTDLKKIVENYEDERNKMHRNLGLVKEDGILPTEDERNKNLRKRNVKENLDQTDLR
jgi:hypothetical protein